MTLWDFYKWQFTRTYLLLVAYAYSSNTEGRGHQSISIISSNLSLNWSLAIHNRGAARSTCSYFGFFTEFLGLSSAFASQLPNARFEYPVCSDAFYASLFPSEELRYVACVHLQSG